MTNEQVLGKVSNALELLRKGRYMDVDIALKEIKADLASCVAESAEVKSVSILKAAQKFAKLCAKECAYRSAWNGANKYVDSVGNDHEYIMDGYCGVVYDKPFGDLLVRADGEPFDMESFLRSVANAKNDVIVPSYTELKRIDIAQRKSKSKDGIVILENGTCVYLKYLLTVMECTGIASECADECTEWMNDSNVSALYIHRGNAHGIVMPVRPSYDTKWNVVKDCRTITAGQMKEGN